MNGERKDFLKVTPPASAGVRDSGNRVEQNHTPPSILQLQPRLVRLPKPGTLCPFTGLSRTQIYLLCKSGNVKSHNLKRRGTCRGIRLIDFQSLVAAVEEFASAENQETQEQ
jgi:hypothetical protein